MSIDLYLDSMTWQEFEDLVAYLLRKMGFEQVAPTRRTADGGKDIIAYRRDARGTLTKYCIECKHRRGPRGSVGRPDVQRLRGVVAGDRYASRGILVTSGRFTRQAEEFARKSGRIELIDRGKLTELVRKHGSVRTARAATTRKRRAVALLCVLFAAICLWACALLGGLSLCAISSGPDRPTLPKATHTPASPTPDVELPTPVLLHTIGRSHLFAEPDTHSTVIAVLDRDTVVVPVEQTRDGLWCRVTVPEHQVEGWMYTAMISGIEELLPLPTREGT